MKPRELLERIARPFSSSSSRRGGGAERRRREEEEADLEAIAAREQRAFRYEALSAATRGFSERQKLGQGGFGPVYRGRLADGREVAVKRLGAGSRQGAREFRNEATLLSRVQHRNVVNLIGYCAHGPDDKLLVYEYVPNESLDKILFSSPPPPPRNSHCEYSNFFFLRHCLPQNFHRVNETSLIIRWTRRFFFFFWGSDYQFNAWKSRVHCFLLLGQLIACVSGWSSPMHRSIYLTN